ncbi:MAG: MFS transporter [Bacteroidetes bacterium]|nr:MFS transporter [Bacteroidota bacterium]
MNENPIVPVAVPDRITSSLWTTYAICFLSTALGGAVSVLMSVYLPTVVRDLLGKSDPDLLVQVSSYINATFLIGWTIGGVVWGVIGDRIGRARAVALAFAMFGLFTVLIAFAPSWGYVIACRFFAGFGVGGVLVVTVTLLLEIWPLKTRAIIIGIISVAFPIGIFSAGTINYFIAGWREGFMAGVVPLVVGLLSLPLLQESERWKQDRLRPQEKNDGVHLTTYSKQLIMGSVIFGTMLIGLWAVFSWVPTWVQSMLPDGGGQKERGMSMMILGGGALLGGVVSGWTINFLGFRKAMLLCFGGCFALSFVLFKLNTTFTTIAMVEMSLLAIFFGISQGVLSGYLPQLFPVKVRATATGLCFNVGRIFTSAAVFFVGSWVTALGGYGHSIFFFSWVFVIGLAAVFFTKKEQTLY